MLVQNSQKLHPEFDLAEARRIFIEARADQDITGEQITSPYDLFSVETLRDAHGLRTGRAVPTDVFVFGKGEAPRRDGTKVGGIPYWPADRPWPRTPTGAPYHFLAQFNFADSRDLFSDLPGDVLLILVHGSEEWFWELEQIRFEWLPSGLTVCSRFDESLIWENIGPFFGALSRTADYPDAVGRASALEVSRAYELPILEGTKIGGLPHLIQGGDDTAGEFLCQLGSIQAAPDVPYPWVNQAAPLGLGSDQRGIYSDENSVVLCDMGNLYLFRGSDGTVRSSFEYY
jgi:hypothetical protein